MTLMMSDAPTSDALFFRAYSGLLFAALAWTHASLRRYATYVDGNCRFGHWRYPLPASSQSTLFGLVSVPQLGVQTWDACFAALQLSLVVCMLTLSRLAAAVATVLCLLYFGRVRTHGLVHNKADLACTKA